MPCGLQLARDHHALGLEADALFDLRSGGWGDVPPAATVQLCNRCRQIRLSINPPAEPALARGLVGRRRFGITRTCRPLNSAIPKTLEFWCAIFYLNERRVLAAQSEEIIRAHDGRGDDH